MSKDTPDPRGKGPEAVEEPVCCGRREFLTLGACAGLGGLAAAIAGAGMAGYLWPNVSYGPPAKFRVAADSLPDPGTEETLVEQRVLLRRNREGKIAAISLVCTHLGCTVNRRSSGFACPCHGSQYDDEGRVVGGPAPKTLAWHRIKALPGGQLEIDTQTREPEGTFFEVKGA